MKPHQAFRALRRQMHLPLRFVAKGAGVSAPALCKWEKTGKGLAEWRTIEARRKLAETARLWRMEAR